ncbi:MAG: helix-turn-helix transcriptional regulator [Lachnospiraceae bacterium]|jgi:AraC-like DNA-binding protein|nr:helix-turn-helix transcriptional regulator [Lachnospiraceae bacterium]
MRDVSISKEILTYIENNLDKTLTLEKIAKDLNYSKFYMARVFKENVGVTVYQYIRRRRLDIAANRLVNTKQSMTEIALEAGYGSQQAFTRAFGFEYGCTPLEYRRSMAIGRSCLKDRAAA